MYQDGRAIQPVQVEESIFVSPHPFFIPSRATIMEYIFGGSEKDSIFLYNHDHTERPQLQMWAAMKTGIIFWSPLPKAVVSGF